MITSSSNAGIRRLVQLRDKARERERQGLFLVEGVRAFKEIPGRLLDSVYVSESFSVSGAGKEIIDGCKGGVLIVSDPLFNSMSDTKNPQGIMALVKRLDYGMEDLTGGNALIVVLEKLQDPGNLGTIVRSAEGAGVSGILLGKGCADIYNPKVIRSTMGSVFRVPFCYTDDLKGAISYLKSLGIRICAAHLSGREDYDEADYTGPCAFLIGNEGNGLTEETAKMADLKIRIPMCGKVESLNAAVACSLLTYEAFRQRRHMPDKKSTFL